MRGLHALILIVFSFRYDIIRFFQPPSQRSGLNTTFSEGLFESGKEKIVVFRHSRVGIESRMQAAVRVNTGGTFRNTLSLGRIDAATNTIGYDSALSCASFGSLL